MYSVVLMMALSGSAESADFGHHKKGCSGCSGAVSCSGYVGCSGCSCSGGHARKHHKHKHRSRCSGCTGCNGCTGYVGCTGSNGCTGYVGCTGGVGCAGGEVVPYQGGTVPPAKMMPKEKIPTPPAKTEAQAPATIIVSLPAEARLTVDGNATSSTSERRTLVTPAIETGADFVYTLRAEIVRDGRTVVETQLVTVRGGETTNVPFTFSQGIASR